MAAQMEYRGYAHFCPADYKYEGYHNSTLRFDNSVEWVIELR